eukprot:764241-Hanusia_phi.AAC.2
MSNACSHGMRQRQQGRQPCGPWSKKKLLQAERCYPWQPPCLKKAVEPEGDISSGGQRESSRTWVKPFSFKIVRMRFSSSIQVGFGFSAVHKAISLRALSVNQSTQCKHDRVRAGPSSASGTRIRRETEGARVIDISTGLLVPANSLSHCVASSVLTCSR